MSLSIVSLPLFEVLEVDGRAAGDAGERVFGDAHVQAGGVGDHRVDAAQQCAAAGQDDAVVDQVGGQFRLGPFQRAGDRFDDRADAAPEGPRGFPRW